MRIGTEDRRRTAVVVVMLLVLLVAGSLPVAGASQYRSRHYDLQLLPWRQLSFTGWYHLRLPPQRPIDRRGIPLRREGRLLVYPVGELSMNGMRRLMRFRVRCERPQLAQALRQGAKLRELAVSRRHAWWIPHTFDYAPFGMHSPWFNAMTQGLAISFFVRLYRLTGEAAHLQAARRVFRSFLRLGRAAHPWVAYVDQAHYLWLEHYPNGHPAHILNAHMHALFGLYEYWALTRSPVARQVLEAAITTMDDHVSRYRRPGRASLYGLRGGWSSVKYHRIHVWQIRLLGAITGEVRFATMADRFASDVPGPPSKKGAPAYPRPPSPRPCPAA